MTPYCSRAASLRSPSETARSWRRRASSSWARTLRTSSMAPFSSFHCAVIASDFALSSFSSTCSSSSRFFELGSFSFFSAISSISSLRTWREISSSSCGQESISVLILAHASSSRSIALSGRKRSWMYRAESATALTSASSRMRTLWYFSKRSLMPRRIDTASSSLGGSTITGWKRRSSAASFSMYRRYSSSVVAPTQCSSPRASIGLSMLPASLEPSVLPAPTMVWISSMKRMILPSESRIFFSTALSRSSNWPRYDAPAISAVMSSENTIRSRRPSGTSPRTMRCASPSTIAVLPTPGSPISTGLFLVLRERMRITSRISVSRPITGSSRPERASAVRSLPYFSSTFSSVSGFS